MPTLRPHSVAVRQAASLVRKEHMHLGAHLGLQRVGRQARGGPDAGQVRGQSASSPPVIVGRFSFTVKLII